MPCFFSLFLTSCFEISTILGKKNYRKKAIENVKALNTNREFSAQDLVGSWKLEVGSWKVHAWGLISIWKFSNVPTCTPEAVTTSVIGFFFSRKRF